MIQPMSDFPPVSLAKFEFEVGDVAVANRIDQICDRFENAWRSGHEPRIGEFLDDSVGPHSSALFAELVRIDIEYRARQGETASLDEYSSQFPEFSEVISKLKSLQPYEPTVVQPKPQTAYSIGKYELRTPVGRGGYGTVWKAWDTEMSRWVAIKLPRERHDSRNSAAAFLREAQAAAELVHPNIVPIIDSGTVSGTPYIVSRFIEGISLRQWFDARKKLLGPREIAELCAQLADAMDHARVQRVIHCDLKPSNILIDTEGQPHITDFGLASRKMPGWTLEPSSIAGTPTYMSPEQVEGAEKLDHRSDVYALGVILYELLTGAAPFSGGQAALFHQIVHVDPVPLRQHKKSIPTDLDTICLKALAKEPGKRYQTAGEMAADLRRFLREEPIQARKFGRLEKAWRWARRNRALTGAVSAAVVTGTAAILLALQPAGVAAPEKSERLITFYTDPPGARVVFYKRDDRTGEPIPEERTEAPHVSPIKMGLPPGDYFVVAALDQTRFHEVYRHVPAWDEKMKMAGEDFWETDDDDPGAIMLGAVVKIPNADVTSGMALLQGSREFSVGVQGSTILPQHTRNVADFYIDPTEVTFAQCNQVYPGLRLPDVNREAPLDHALVISANYAARVAEKLGKRLPTEIEYEYAATNRGQSRFPWGNAEPTEEQLAADGFLPVGQPHFDVLPTEPPVSGLCSNVAEWTTTYASLYPPMAFAPFPGLDIIPGTTVKANRVVRGPIPLRKSVHEQSLHPIDPRNRRFLTRMTMQQGVGLRCVRSATPHLKTSDFYAKKQ